MSFYSRENHFDKKEMGQRRLSAVNILKILRQHKKAARCLHALVRKNARIFSAVKVEMGHEGW